MRITLAPEAKREKTLILLGGLLLFWSFSYGAAEVPANRFVYTQLQHGTRWDPYPNVWSRVRVFLEQKTSVIAWPNRRVITLEDPQMFESSFLVLLGRGPVSFSENQLARLKNYLEGGGFLFIDNTEAERLSPFARSCLPLLEQLFPHSRWEPLPTESAVFRSYFLLKRVSGRRLAEPNLKGLKVGGRVAVVYSANDLHGAWVRDHLGNPLFACEPGGEPQRWEAMKLLTNIILFHLTGTYKEDLVHQDAINEKLRN